jgi:DNA end-binding protein Ku
VPDEDAALDFDGHRPVWSGSVGFGLVSIPVNLYAATRSERRHARTLAPDGAHVLRRFCCPADGKLLEEDEIVRGYELEEDRYVPVTDEELEALEPKKSRNIDLQLFVEADELDPMYFAHAYVLAPAPESKRPYQLLAAVMQERERVGIATFIMHAREHVVALVAEHGVLWAETLRFAEELRPLREIVLPADARKGHGTDASFDRAISALSKGALELDALFDPANTRLERLLDSKRRHGQEVVQAPAEVASDGAKVIDLMEVLKQSLEEHRARSAPKAEEKGPRRVHAPASHKRPPRKHAAKR